MQMHDSILLFLKKQTCFTLATSVNDIPYSANCFYVFWTEEKALLFKSNPSTRHIREAIANSRVSGTIVPDRLNPLAVQGIQFGGAFSKPEGALLKKVQSLYYKKYPYALLHKGNFWMVHLTEVKMTDSCAGKRKKYLWSRF